MSKQGGAPDRTCASPYLSGQWCVCVCVFGVLAASWLQSGGSTLLSLPGPAEIHEATS